MLVPLRLPLFGERGNPTTTATITPTASAEPTASRTPPPPQQLPPQPRSLASPFRPTPRIIQHSPPQHARKPRKTPRPVVPRKHLFLLLSAVAAEMLLIALYLGLVLSLGDKLRREYHVFLLVLIIATTIGLALAVLRMYLAFTRVQKKDGRNGRRRVKDVEQGQRGNGSGGAEGAGRTEEGTHGAWEHYQPPSHTATPPPVYGCWRQSTHISPSEPPEYHRYPEYHHNYSHSYNPSTVPATLQPNSTSSSTTPQPSSIVSPLSPSPPSAISPVSPLAAQNPPRPPPKGMLRIQTTRPWGGDRPREVQRGGEGDADKERRDARQLALLQLGGVVGRR